MKIRRSITPSTSRRAKVKELSAKISGAKERAAAARHQAEAAKADYKRVRKTFKEAKKAAKAARKRLKTLKKALRAAMKPATRKAAGLPGKSGAAKSPSRRVAAKKGKPAKGGSRRKASAPRPPRKDPNPAIAPVSAETTGMLTERPLDQLSNLDATSNGATAPAADIAPAPQPGPDVEPPTS